jgi:hypothetical protein
LRGATAGCRQTFPNIGFVSAISERCGCRGGESTVNRTGSACHTQDRSASQKIGAQRHLSANRSRSSNVQTKGILPIGRPVESPFLCAIALCLLDQRVSISGCQKGYAAC